MLSWLRHRRWRFAPRLSPAEFAVAKALLWPSSDMRYSRLLQQAKCAPGVERQLLSHSHYRATIPFVVDASLLIDLDLDLWSPFLDVREKTTGRTLRFRLSLLRGGFLRAIEGQTIDGDSWIPDWDIDTDAASAASEQQIRKDWLPPQMSDEQRAEIVRRLEDWLDVAPGTIGRIDRERIKVFSPLDTREIQGLEQVESVHCPTSYSEFLQISNGIEIVTDRPIIIGGKELFYQVSLENESKSFVMISDLLERGAILMNATDRADDNVYLADETSAAVSVLSSLKQYISDIIELVTDA